MNITVVDPVALDELRDEVRRLREIVRPARAQIWYSKKECAELKGISYNVLTKKPHWHWPNAGESKAIVHNSRYSECFHRDDVELWLEM